MTSKELSDIIKSRNFREEDIAVIGFACNFPKASNIEEFWDNLIRQTDCITRIPEDRWDNSLYFDEKDIGAPLKSYSNKGGFINSLNGFDRKYFRIREEEEKLMDPKHKIMLENAREALKHAGYLDKIDGADAGVFMGTNFNFFGYDLKREEILSKDGMMGNGNPLIAHRISNAFNLTGPSYVIDSYCASGITGLHLACKSLYHKECSIAVAGAVHVLSYLQYIQLCQLKAISPNGLTRSFDQEGDGYIPGEGAATVVLKPVIEALKDGDMIHAIIKGSYVNHAGSANQLGRHHVSETQEILIKRTLKMAGVSPETISYVEANSEGIPIDDIMEIKALKNAFGKTEKKHYCGLGSVKTNIGHLAATSGFAGLIKIILCLQHKELPGILHFNQLNRFIDIKNSSFYINDTKTSWEGINGIRRAGLNNFNVTGAYTHVILEEGIPG